MIGQTFGEWLVLDRANDYVSPAGKHYAQWRCRCSCGIERVVRSTNLTCGISTECGHSRFPQPLTYTAAHKRVRRARGAARRHSCIDCGAPAAQWSYRGDSPDEIVGEVAVVSDGYKYTSTVAWSPNVGDYEPRCVADHRAYDQDRRTAEARSA